ncbi:MAG: PIN domain-containing protein [Halobacteria archaeon]|nr:PIN domain-containing protein [Halobacteria archaeon]
MKYKSLIVDTSGFYAAYVEDDDNFERADTVLEGIRNDELPYRPVYTNRFVLSELATLMLYRVGHHAAVEVLDDVLDSGIRVLNVDSSAFHNAKEGFEKYDDAEISFFDHLTAVLARENEIDHIFTFDESDFETLGFSAVPKETSVIE